MYCYASLVRSFARISAFSFLGLSACSLTFSGPLQRHRAVLSQPLHTTGASSLFAVVVTSVCIYSTSINQIKSPLFLFSYQAVSIPKSSACLINSLIFHSLIVGPVSLLCGKEQKIYDLRRAFGPFISFLFVFVVVCPFLLHSVTRRLASAHSCCMWYTASTFDMYSNVELPLMRL